MKVLYYNWVDFLDAERRAGGVTVYQRNLMAAAAESDDLEAWFLCSGVSYDLMPGRAPRWERVRHGAEWLRERRFEIVNSGTLAPSHHSFGNPAQVEHAATAACMCDFVAATGPFDVIHFNNFEGVPVTVLDALRARFPATRIVFSLHNYYPICPQVNLWYRERALCTDFEGGRACRNCLIDKPQERHVRQANAVAYRLKRLGVVPGTLLFDRGFQPLVRTTWRAVRALSRLRRRPDPLARPAPHEDFSVGAKTGLQRLDPPGRAFAARRAAMIAAINRNCDRVLGVSERVSDLARAYGIAPELVQTSYIGTRHAHLFAQTAPRGALPRADGTLALGYLGYMRRDKGFVFLLDALEALPNALAARVHLVVAAPRGEEKLMRRLHDLSDRLASVEYADGYSQDGLDAILADVDVGVVPVLWEDNLPQVAIEMHARHIPLLTSDRGGPRELGRCPEMVFPAGDRVAFAERVRFLLEGRLDVDAYWAGAMAPQDVATHMAELRAVYRGAARPAVAAGDETEAAAAEKTSTAAAGRP